MLSCPSAPDYADRDMWAALPAHVRTGGCQENMPSLPADVFYLPGTLQHGSEAGFFDPFKPALRALAVRDLRTQASAFARAGHIFMPHVRQLSMETHFLPEKERRKAFTVPLQDAERAFLHYLEHWNRGRPLLLAGQSQGAAILLHLLKNMFGNRGIYRCLVAAYLPGLTVTESDLAMHPNMRLASRQDDTGVIITYNTLSRSGKKAITLRPGALCVNPLNWTNTQDYAPRELHLGMAKFDVDGRTCHDIPHFTDAWIDPLLGALVAGAPELDSLRHYSGIRAFFPPGDLHCLNITLFYRNLEENAVRRVHSFVARRTETIRKVRAKESS